MVHGAGVVWQRYGSVMAALGQFYVSSMSVLCQFYVSSMAALGQFYGSVRSVLCQFYVRGYAPRVAPVWTAPPSWFQCGADDLKFSFPSGESPVINVIASRRSASAVPARDARTATRASRRGVVVDGIGAFGTRRVSKLEEPELGSRRRSTFNRPGLSLGRVAGGARRPFRFVVFLLWFVPLAR